MKIRMLCTLANPDDVRFAPINNPENTIRLRGLDLQPEKGKPMGGFEPGNVYDVELVFKQV